MTISARKVLLILIFSNLFLMIVHVLTQFLVFHFDVPPFARDIISRFNMDNEVSIPTWFAQTLLFITSLLFAYMAFVAKAAKAKFVKTWWFLAGLFLYASIDEGASLHELATTPFQEIFNVTGGIFFFAWVIPGGILFLLICLGLLKFFLHLPRQSKIIFASAAISLFFALCVEMISGVHWQADGVYDGFLYLFLNILEEGFENTAFILTIYGLLRHITLHKSDALPKITITD